MKPYSERLMQGLRLLYEGGTAQLQYKLLHSTKLPIEILLSTDDTSAFSAIENVVEIHNNEFNQSSNLEQIFAVSFLKNIQSVLVPVGKLHPWGDVSHLSQILITNIKSLRTITLVTNLCPNIEVLWNNIQEWQDRLVPTKIELRIEVHIEKEEITFSSPLRENRISESLIKLTRLASANALQLSVICWLNSDNCIFADDWQNSLEDNQISSYIFRNTSDNKCSEGSSVIDLIENKNFHLIGFFDKLANKKTTAPEARFYYQFIVRELSSGDYRNMWGKRPVLSRVILTPQKKALYCSLFNWLGQFGLFTELPNQEKINQGMSLIMPPWQSKWRSLTRRINYAPRLLKKADANNQPQNWQNVLITGWYGTETTGDKAILGELVHFLRTYNPEVNITITSIDEKVSWQTNRELDLKKNIHTIEIAKAADPKIIDKMDAVVIGGGPLMDSSQLEYIWNMFRFANQAKRARIIYGCGIGPIHSSRTERFIREICSLASAGFYRDQKSYAYAINLGGNPGLLWACDPSLGYLTRWRNQHSTPSDISQTRAPHVAGLFRAQTKEYYSAPDLVEKNNWFATQVALTLGQISTRFHETEITLLPMHMYWKGNDDRLFNRKIAQACDSGLPVEVVRAYLPLQVLLEKLFRADVSIAMRYHGHLFSLALGIPFLSVNYTNRQGKVSYLLERMGYSYKEEFETYNAQNAGAKIENLYTRREEIRELLLNQTNEMVNRLHQVYEEAFGARP